MKGVVVISDPAYRGSSARSGRLDALECVANRPIAHHVLDSLESAGTDEVIVASSAARATEVRASLDSRGNVGGLRLTYGAMPTRPELDGAFEQVARVIDGSPCIVHWGAGLLGEPLELLLARVESGWPDVVLMAHQGDSAGGHLRLASQQPSVAAVSECERVAAAVAGVFLFGPDGLARAIAASPCGKNTDLKSLADRLIDHGASFEVLRVNGWRQYAGDPLDLLELNRIALDRLEAETPAPNSDGNRIEGRVRIHERASVRASVIVGPAVIGPGARIADAYIGPYTSIGAGALVEGAEIERSIVDLGASITHVGDRLVACVVGRDARVFRDFSLPRALRLRVGDGTEVALC
jgi:glucose-1-phosphate thymidylyltransferase